MDFNTIIYEQDAGIAIITLNRPRALNALNNQLIEELDQVFDAIAQDSAVSAVIICGHDKAFAAGADIKEISQLTSPALAFAFASRVRSAFDKIENLPKPVIAAVSGLALGGGCELSLACDIRIAAENAVFGQPEIKIGVIPGGGGTQRLPRLIGMGRAKEMLYTAEAVNAGEAYRIGLVNQVVALEDLRAAALKMAKKIARQPPLAFRMTKTAVQAGAGMDLGAALTHEARCFEWLFSTEDQKEGMRAFIEKRKPNFQGR